MEGIKEGSGPLLLCEHAEKNKKRYLEEGRVSGNLSQLMRLFGLKWNWLGSADY